MAKSKKQPEPIISFEDNKMHWIIGRTNVSLIHWGEGKGQVIIKIPYYDHHVELDHYWGAMGDEGILDFVKTSYADYFAGKLSRTGHETKFNLKATFVNIRKAIREWYPWYQDMDVQKEFREKLREVQDNLDEDSSQEAFVDAIEDLRRSIKYDKDFTQLYDLLFEPWNYISMSDSDEVKHIKYIHSVLVKHLKTNKYEIVTTR